MYKCMMIQLNQKTISKPLLFEGIGLHTGLVSRVKIIPSEANTGIVFKRVDINENNLIEADYRNVSCARLCTTLKNKSGVTVSTVEHLMAAFYITGIDNAVVEINNSEIPIMDGSSKDFVKLITKTGLSELKEQRKYLKIVKKIEFSDDQKTISIEPHDEGLSVDFQIGYNNEVIGNQQNSVSFYDQDLEDIYSSRTFCLFEDIEEIKKIGLAKGGSLDNAIVVKNEEVLNKGGLRNKKEFVNHKILDLAGDFLLSGFRILGKVKCTQGGHHLSNVFIKEIFKDVSNFEEQIINNVKVFKKDFKSPANKLAVNA